jgi:D-serine dehydratase
MHDLNKGISPLEKGLGAITGELTCASIANLKWNILREDMSLPVAILYEDNLLHNLRWMQDFISRYRVKLAPHGKTTMAPRLFQMQLQGGAWGITLATAQQTEVAYAHGVRRVFMANQLIGKENLAKIARLLTDSTFDFYCLVDSAENLAQLGTFFAEQSLRLKVLIELGIKGGRAGVRDLAALTKLLDGFQNWRDSISLCGIEVYEGVLSTEAEIREFLQRAVQTTRQLAQDKVFDRSPVLLSGAGSAWYDVVAECFSSADIGVPLEVVLRPGCYLTHDVGAYQTAHLEIQKRNPVAAEMKSSLKPALRLWAYVQSIPEDGHAIIGLGKRDAAFDAGLPKPSLHFRPGNQIPESIPESWTLTKMMDQHAYLQFPPGGDLRVGDMVEFNISHPCLTFDKWKVLPIVNREFDVIDLVQTYF